MRGMIGLALLAASVGADERPLIGFTPESSRRQREMEAAFLALPAPDRCEAHHRELTRLPHTAGTEGSRRVAAYVADRFRESWWSSTHQSPQAANTLNGCSWPGIRPLPSESPGKPPCTSTLNFSTAPRRRSSWSPLSR